MIDGLCVGKFESKEKKTIYNCLVFTTDYGATVKVFADNQTLLTLLGAEPRVLFELKVGETIPIKLGK